MLRNLEHRGRILSCVRWGMIGLWALLILIISILPRAQNPETPIAAASPISSPNVGADEKSLFKFPSLPEKVDVGHPVDLTVTCGTPTSYEYQWCTYYAGNWTANDWGGSSSFQFKPREMGRYAIQVNIRKKGADAALAQKWLGEIEVAGSLVNTIVLSPSDPAPLIGARISFTITPLAGVPPESLEYNLVELRPNEKDPNAPFVPKTIFDWRALPLPAYTVPGPAGKVLSLQMNIRRREAPWQYQLLWLCDLTPQARAPGAVENQGKPVEAATPVPAPAADTSETIAVKFPALPETLAVGHLLDLTVTSDTPTSYEYQWATKYADNWGTRDWSPSPDFQFNPQEIGRYAIEVNLRRKGTASALSKKWLGEIVVQGPLVSRIVTSPPYSAMSIGTSITFWISPLADVPAESLEFTLLELRQSKKGRSAPFDSKTVFDWHALPLPDYIVPGPSGESFSLQMNIRRREAPWQYQGLWLGSWTPHSFAPPGKANLLRALIADDFDKSSSDEGMFILADELNLCVHMLNWEYEGAGVEQQKKGLGSLANVSSFEKDGSPGVVVTFKTGEAYEVDLAGRTLNQRGSPIRLLLDLKQFKHYRTLFDRCKGLDNEGRVLAGITFAVYEGYDYGPVETYLQKGIATPVSHCGTLSLLMANMLRHLGTPVQYAGFDRILGQISHLFVQARTSGKQYLMLDPSAGYIYPFSLEEVGTRKTLDPIIMPQIRNLSFLNLSGDWKPGELSFGLFETFKPGIIPFQAVDGKVMVP